MLVITIADGEQRGRSVDREEGVITLGRGPGNDLRLDDEYVSSRHGQVLVQKDRCLYQDLASSNGSVVKRGKKQWLLSKEMPEMALEDGDVLVLGRTALEVRIGQTEVVLASTDLAQLADTDAALRRDRETLTALYEMERQIHLEMDADKLARRVLQATLDAFPPATSACIARMNPATLEIADVTSLTAPGRKQVRVSRSMAGKALQEKRAICFQDAQTALCQVNSVVASGIQCAMCAPLWTGSEVRGVLQVASTTSPRCFSNADLDLLTVFANRAAIALANAELNEERQRTAHFKELTDYLANELRCAATGLVEWLKPLEDGDFGALEDLQLEAVRTARLGAQMVSTLVTSMTDLSQLKQPGLVIETEPVELARAAEVPVGLAGAKGDLEGIAVTAELDPSLPPVLADRLLLQRVMLNALFFAMAWADAAEPVLVTGRVETQDASLDETRAEAVTVSVEWSGDPIPDERLEHIFDPEAQAKMWRDLGRRSVGVGLAFCKLAVEMLQGRTWFDQCNGRLALRFSLPAAVGNRAEAEFPSADLYARTAG